MTTTMRVSLAGLLLAAATPLAAQLPNTSASATALGGNYTARARGYEAISWNPALLAAPDRPGFSIGLLSVGGTSGLDPIDINDISAYQGKVIPASVKAQWLADVRAAGEQRGDGDAGATPIALSIGNFGLQYSVSAYGATALNGDATEAILYGNAGSTGQVRSFNFSGSSMDAGVVSTAAASYAFRVPTAAGTHLALGVTGKYVMGHFVARAEDNGSTTTPNQVTVNFPVIHSDIENGAMNGKGMGLDVGAAWTAGRLRIGGTVANVLNTFAWDETKMVYRPGTAYFSADSSSSQFDDTTYTMAPASLRESIAEQKFKPRASVGVALDVNRMLTLSGDVRADIGEGILIGPKNHVGVGAELRAIPFLPLRAGVAKIADGWQAAGGLGLKFGRYELGVGATLRNRSQGKATGLTINAVTVR